MVEIENDTQENGKVKDAKEKDTMEIDPDASVKQPSFPATPVFVNHRGSLTWDDLPIGVNLRKGLAKKGFVVPSTIQEKILPAILSDRKNTIAQAKNGSGKTAAFCLSILATVTEEDHTQALLLSHSHELARQNLEVLRELGKYTSFTYKLLIPSGDFMEKGDWGHIIVGTPGKVMDMIKRRILNVSKLKIFVLDEADTLVSGGPLVAQTMDIQKKCPKDVQVLCFSATFSDKTLRFVHEMCPNAYEHRIESTKLSLECIGQYYVSCDSKNSKKEAINKLFACLSISQSVIFVNSRDDARDLHKSLTSHGHTVAILVGGRGDSAMTPDERAQVMVEFKEGRSKVLIATDVIARGIDVPQVTVVINFELPVGVEGDGERFEGKEVYLHRIGRTGRFGAAGISINLVTPTEVQQQKQIETHFNKTIKELPMDPEEIEEIIRNLRSDDSPTLSPEKEQK